MAVLTPRSTIEGLSWPALPERRGQVILALLGQFEQSQWWPPETLREQQFRQLELLLRHAAATVPFYRERLAQAGIGPGAPVTPELTPELWNRIPVLTRREVQGAFEALRSERIPKSHGRRSSVYTSGSTATPIKVLKTDISQLFWQALTVRDHLWHRRDLGGKLAAIRPTKDNAAAYPDGAQGRSWGRASNLVFATGPSALLDIGSKIDQQAEWLARQDPDYLVTFPSNLKVLARYCAEHDIRLANLKEAQSVAELLEPEVREACRAAWDVPVADTYSAQEVGYIALACHEHASLHVQAEDVLVEILDDSNRPCAPGEVGQVVVTPLHNFAMPLIRYQVGDLAEVGEPCPCGRGLPVLSRVLGRLRGMVRLPNGEQHLPNYQDMLKGFDDVIQFQIVRRAEQELEMKLVMSHQLSADEAQELKRRVCERFKHPFAVTFTYHDEIPRGPGGKFQDYVP